MTNPKTNIVPLLRGDYPDPSIVRVGDDYYLTHSSNQYSPGLLIWHSRDLVNWTPLGTALSRYDGDVWAPDICYHDGLFYLYYTTTGGNHVVSADRAEGPWSEPINLYVGHIDPCHVVDDDGKRYLFLSGGHLVKLTDDGLATDGDVTQIYNGWPIPAHWRIEGYALEGPKVLRRNGWYYLVCAIGGTSGPSTSHMVTIARSRAMAGPWEECPYNPIVRTRSREEQWWSRGHGTIFDTPAGDWWIVYHGYERGYYTLGRSTLLEPIVWTEDGWPVADASCARVDALPDQIAPVPLSDDFQSDMLGWKWRFQGDFDPNRAHVGGGQLAIEAELPNLADGNAPLTIVARDHSYAIEVDVEINPDTVEAGLVLYYSHKRYVALAIGREGIGLRRGGQLELFEQLRAVPQATLRLVNDDQEIDFFFRLPGREWVQIASGQEVSGWHHNSFGGFVSLRAGLYASGDGIALFKSFRYDAIG